ncbi:rhodanese-like domain-containing protein [Halostella sp. PRR32]|uniref:rhodanese-like domain-containing protein n=1 Tax=Halostella sp. PRR32 TaxID=3098147 RepID=UPI00110E91AB|nr:rhodanese-like domain-containing protein [Halostella sp. PRR32]
MDGEISPDEVQTLLSDDADVTVVDIRSPAGFRRGHIPGSVNVPFQRLPNEVNRLADAERIVTVCPHGKSSVQAARLVASHEGVDATSVESMAGGLDAWEYELDEKTNGDETEGPDAPF